MAGTHLDLIKSRKSIRTYDSRPLEADALDKLVRYFDNIKNPYGQDIVFRILDTKKNGLKSAVVTGAQHYIAGKMRKIPHCEEAFGFSFESAVLFAWSMGIGTVWLGGTFDRADFEQAMELENDEIMPCVSPIGYPAAKMSIRETLMRKSIKADNRMKLDEIVFDGSFSSFPNLPDNVTRILEAVRWAPSAVNKQPWRIIVSGDTFHFYKKQHKGFMSDAAGDLQKIDMGIALCHFDNAARNEGFSPVLSLDVPDINAPEDMQYTASYILG